MRDEVFVLGRAHQLHPWTNFGPFEEQGSLVIERGEGCWLWDAEGRRYFDAVGGMWCTNIGLGRTEMAEAIGAQVERGRERRNHAHAAVAVLIQRRER